MATTAILLPLLLFSFITFDPLLTSAAAAGTTTRCHPDDESALLDFKRAMTDPLNMLDTWKPRTDCCSWSSVACVGPRVASLMLSGLADDPKSFLAGNIPASFSKLQGLRFLYLTDLKNITGPFPPALLRMPSLTRLYIHNAQLSGELPAEDIALRLPRLEQLGLAKNQLTGAPLPSLTGLTHLISLVLSNNQFYGEIPSNITTLRNLTFLALEDNGFFGVLPDLSPLTQLIWLTLSKNRFNNGVPLLPKRLMTLAIADNILSLTIPSQLGELTELTELDLSNNYISGAVPSSLANLAKLNSLDLSMNFLEDPMPEIKAEQLKSIDLSNNKFNFGRVPKWIESSSILSSLKLRSCGISMRMEDLNIAASTTTLEYLDMWNNNITGSPVGMVNSAQKLTGLNLGRNKLRFDMGTLKLPSTLKSLDLSDNLVYGRLPREISRLESLDVSRNHLCGPIPTNKFPATAFAKNDCLCGAPLRKCGRGV